MIKFLGSVIFLALTSSLFAQTNVRAWYAQGQVWVVWQAEQPLPETFGIYKKTTAFSNSAQATIIGRLFHFEYLPGTFWEQMGDTTFTYRIPKPDGTTYQLAPGEGLFVETVTNSSSAFYAVVAWGNTAVAAGVNITDNAVQSNYNPVTQPVNCHLQHTATLLTGHKTAWFAMWALGRQDENAGRPDFPVMANAAKNGMPSMFILSQSLALDTTGGKKIPMTHWFHGGGMVARQFLPDRARHINVEPIQGISVSHNDDFAVKTITETGDTVFTSGRSLWFGWSKSHNPFDQNFNAGSGDTIINYTQRRILWINEWLLAHFPIDPYRVALQGYSMGSAGASALGKAFPDRFSTVCAFNNGYRSGTDPTSEAILGSILENLPTNLRRSPTDVVRVNEVFDLTTPTSPARDFPLFRTWAGKNDTNERMYWSPDLVAQYRLADSLGTGAQISWDERMHTYPVLGMHWIHGETPDQQTSLDDLAFQEFARSDESYPAFFNHRLDAKNNDPGFGIIGINNGDGDNWGTWGGYHRWENIQENNASWQTTAWLESNAVFDSENCPHDFLTADLAIRKPKQFKPTTGTLVYWRVTDFFTNQVLQNGTATIQASDLTIIPQVQVFREDIRKVRIEVSTQPVATEDVGKIFLDIAVSPNPSTGESTLIIYSEKELTVTLRLSNISGVISFVEKQIHPGENRIPLIDLGLIPAGFYFISMEANGQQNVVRWVKM